MSLLTPSSTPSLACWLSHLFTFWHINIESTLCLGGWGWWGVPSPHMISDSGPEVETCVAKNLAPAPDPMRSLSLQRVGAMQICVLEMNGCLLLRSFGILGQISLKKFLHFWVCWSVCVSWSIQSMTVNASHSMYYSWKEIHWQFAAVTVNRRQQNYFKDSCYCDFSWFFQKSGGQPCTFHHLKWKKDLPSI